MDYKQTEGTELKHEWDSTWHHTMKCYSSLLLLFFSLEASTCSVCSAIQKNQYIPFIFLKHFFFYISSFNLVIWLYFFSVNRYLQFIGHRCKTCSTLLVAMATAGTTREPKRSFHPILLVTVILMLQQP